jgi:hypothetical protein
MPNTVKTEMIRTSAASESDLMRVKRLPGTKSMSQSVGIREYEVALMCAGEISRDGNKFPAEENK